MRILTKKIYRAYPELDKFEDSVCKSYVKRARRLQNAWKGGLAVLGVLPFALIVWLIVVWASRVFYAGLNEVHSWQLSGLGEDLFAVFFITGVMWFPFIVCLLVRDRWLHRCLRKQLSGVQCPGCGYSLLGLSLLSSVDDPSVDCPECGHRVVLKDMGLTEADIDLSAIEPGA
ncbi:MAG: hypothetical protein AB8C13_06255 [Phycisphaerales bacterium]